MENRNPRIIINLIHANRDKLWNGDTQHEDKLACETCKRHLNVKVQEEIEIWLTSGSPGQPDFTQGFNFSSKTVENFHI
jgi:hypothetical protein